MTNKSSFKLNPSKWNEHDRKNHTYEFELTWNVRSNFNVKNNSRSKRIITTKLVMQPVSDKLFFFLLIQTMFQLIIRFQFSFALIQCNGFKWNRRKAIVTVHYFKKCYWLLTILSVAWIERKRAQNTGRTFSNRRFFKAAENKMNIAIKRRNKKKRCSFVFFLSLLFPVSYQFHTWSTLCSVQISVSCLICCCCWFWN